MILYEDAKISALKSNLKKARLIKGFTQEALAELSGVNIKSIASYEQNPEKLNKRIVFNIFKFNIYKYYSIYYRRYSEKNIINSSRRD